MNINEQTYTHHLCMLKLIYQNFSSMIEKFSMMGHASLGVIDKEWLPLTLVFCFGTYFLELLFYVGS